MALLEILLGFFISLIVSALVVYIATKLFGEKEGFGTAILAALVGAIIFSLASYFLGMGWIATLIGGIAWLIALGSMYDMGLIKSFIVAILIWVFAGIVNLILPKIALMI